MTYEERTPEAIAADHAAYTDDGVEELARFLSFWMPNELAQRDFHSLASDKKTPPAKRVQAILSHALDWFAYGN